MHISDLVTLFQYTGDNLLEALEFTGRHPKFSKWFKDDNTYVDHVRKDNNLFKIFQPNGLIDEASPSDYLVKDSSGHIRVLEESIIKTRYIEVN